MRQKVGAVAENADNLTMAVKNSSRVYLRFCFIFENRNATIRSLTKNDNKKGGIEEENNDNKIDINFELGISMRRAMTSEWFD